MPPHAGFRFFENRWDESVAATLDAPELLRYRSNLLGSDLRITTGLEVIRAGTECSTLGNLAVN